MSENTVKEHMDLQEISLALAKLKEGLDRHSEYLGNPLLRVDREGRRVPRTPAEALSFNICIMQILCHNFFGKNGIRTVPKFDRNGV